MLRELFGVHWHLASKHLKNFPVITQLTCKFKLLLNVILIHERYERLLLVDIGKFRRQAIANMGIALLLVCDLCLILTSMFISIITHFLHSLYSMLTDSINASSRSTSASKPGTPRFWFTLALFAATFLDSPSI